MFDARSNKTIRGFTVQHVVEFLEDLCVDNKSGKCVNRNIELVT